MRKVILTTVIISIALFFASCGGDSGDTGDTVGDTGDTVGDTGDTVGDTGNTANTGDTANTGNTADSANTSDTGNTVEDTYYGTCNDIAHSGICFDYVGSAYSSPSNITQLTCPTISSTTFYMDHPCSRDSDNFLGYCEYNGDPDDPTTAIVASYYSPKYDSALAKDFCEGINRGVWYDPS